MKTLVNITLMALIVFSLGSCELFDNAFDKKKDKNKTKKFRAEFFTAMTPTDDVRSCEAPFDFYNNQEGEGIAMGMGDFETRIDFCVNFTTLEYIDGQGKLIFNNGDELWITVSGQILPSDDPNYDLMFKDPFQIVGGTGRFEGATGEGMTNSLVKLFPEGGDQTDHVWEGIIVYPK